ncbi:uncharacterized protein M6B38_153790 [Iris pallida]|uniref:Agenet domain-containing protein n=1 Tax=Iris pallida TaxID=29817 RepID=A0AAX6F4W0_IRIPA|nr:uncharacterized protein M6B38_153790 [Iris pallida]
MAKYTPFEVGAEVEVRSAEDGFRGAWFEATVTLYLKKYQRYDVTYTSLFSDDDLQTPLKDLVPFRHIRPRPPRDCCGAGGGFELHRLVDAFHNDGWWVGVVSAVPEQGGGRYGVCFPGTKEEMEFEEADIRDHVSWKKGKWMYKDDAEGGRNVMFGIGSHVEVSRDKQNYGAAWFSGTVLKVIGKSYFLVEYKSLWVDDDRSRRMPRTEIVDLQYLRPSPPSESMNFRVLDEVEAPQHGGWFPGIVSKVLPGSRYIIKFKHQAEEMELDHAALRPHYLWNGGHWINNNQANSRRTSALRGTKSADSRRKSKARKNQCLLTPVPTSRNNDGELADGSEKLKVKVGGSNLDCELSSSQSHKKKKIKSLEHSPIVDAMPLKCNSKTTEVVEKSSPVVATTLEGPNTTNQIKTPQPDKKLKRKILIEDHQVFNDMLVYRDSRRPGASKSSSTAAAMYGGATYKHQSKSSKPKKKLKTGNSLEQLVDGSSENATKVGENSHSEIPSPTLGNSKISSPETPPPSLKVGTNLPSNSCTRDGKVADRSNVNLKDKNVEKLDLDCQVKSSKVHKRVKKQKMLKEKIHLEDDMSGSKTPTTVRKDSSSSVPMLEGQIKSPHSRKFKESKTLVDDRLEDGMLTKHGSKSPTKKGKSSSAVPLLEESPTLMDVPQHLKSPAVVKNAPSPEAATKLSLSPSNRELCHGKDMSKVNGSSESIVGGEGSSNCVGEGSEHQLKAAKISHSLANHEANDFLSVAGGENHSAFSDTKANTKVRRKKRISRTPRPHRKNDMKQQSLDEVKRRGRGRPPVNSYTDVNGMELKNVEERTEHNGKDEGNPLSDVHQSNKLADTVGDHSGKPQIDSSSDGAKSLKCSSTQLSTILASKVFNIEVQGIRSCVNALSGVGAQAETQALLLTSEEDNVYDKIELAPSVSPCGKTAVEMERTTIDHEPTRPSPSKEDSGCDCNEFTPSVLPLEKAIEMDIAPADTRPIGQPPLEEVNVHTDYELTSGESLTEKAVVEMEKRASINPTPNVLSPSNEDDVCDQNGGIPSGCESVEATVEVETPQIIPVHSAPSNLTALPFTKQSSMWDSVYLMDVYRAVPQQPHFRQLEQYSMEFREGIAIGLMVTFANLVSSIRKLRVDDSQVDFQEKLKTLVSLESNGFNVQFVRSCLEKLLEVRRSFNHLKARKAKLEGQLEKREDENCQLDALICAHDKIISEVEQSLTSYRERRSSLLLERNNKDMEIVQLEMDLLAAEEAYLCAEEKFNNAVEAPW